MNSNASLCLSIWYMYTCRSAWAYRLRPCSSAGSRGLSFSCSLRWPRLQRCWEQSSKLSESMLWWWMLRTIPAMRTEQLKKSLTLFKYFLTNFAILVLPWTFRRDGKEIKRMWTFFQRNNGRLTVLFTEKNIFAIEKENNELFLTTW